MAEDPKKFTRTIFIILLVFLGVLAWQSIHFKRKHSNGNQITDTAIQTITTNPIEDSATTPTIPHPMTLKTKVPKNILLGKLTPRQQDSMLIAINRSYASRSGMLMHREAYEAFIRMHEAAKADGITLTIISSWRSFEMQKTIWEDKWNGRQILSGNIRATSISDPTKRAAEILRFSSMPGTSRHHWGTDIDINNLNHSYFNSGKGKQEYNWLRNNAARYGFCQPYTPLVERNNTGYDEEKWHWSYMPVAGIFIHSYNQQITSSDLKGFDGYETAEKLDVISKYVNSISKECERLLLGAPGDQ